MVVTCDGVLDVTLPPHLVAATDIAVRIAITITVGDNITFFRRTVTSKIIHISFLQSAPRISVPHFTDGKKKSTDSNKFAHAPASVCGDGLA